MRRAAALALALAACAEDATPRGAQVGVPGREGASKSSALARAERRMYDGAPPVIPHRRFGPACTACHDEHGIAVEGVGFAPPSPHEKTAGMSAISRCTQCHVFRETDEVFVANEFEGLRRGLRPGPRLYPGAPPVIPHALQMRENCAACHSGPAAREEIRCSHPERPRCAQCHVPQSEASLFARP